MFIDRVVIRVKSGKGGDGLVSFRRERYVPRGGPSGGDGGRGGDVIIEVDPQLHTLMDYRYQKVYEAAKGQPGGTSNKTGKNGRNTIIRVPLGTVVRDAEEDVILADLTERGERLTVAIGGKGGHGNARFKTPTRQTPDWAYPGRECEETTLELELKLLADVGLVGFPNAGKSTLLSAVSEARPKIADYPFTTLEPNLGIVRTADFRSLVMADIPGLIEGASDGKGLGKEFLRHIERTRVLLFIVDASVEDPMGEYRTLMGELEKHDPALLNKPRVLCLSKIDLLGDAPTRPKGLEKSVPFMSISAVAHRGLDELLREMDRFVHPPEEVEDSPIPAP
jgi:GTP-binding protein